MSLNENLLSTLVEDVSSSKTVTLGTTVTKVVDALAAPNLGTVRRVRLVNRSTEEIGVKITLSDTAPTIATGVSANAGIVLPQNEPFEFSVQGQFRVWAVSTVTGANLNVAIL